MEENGRRAKGETRCWRRAARRRERIGVARRAMRVAFDGVGGVIAASWSWVVFGCEEDLDWGVRKREVGFTWTGCYGLC
jgi:uncharacterized membrane protein